MPMYHLYTCRYLILSKFPYRNYFQDHQVLLQKKIAKLPPSGAEVFKDPTVADTPHLISQAELNDLVRDLDLTEEKSEMLGSRLKQWDLLQSDVNITIYRNHHSSLIHFFSKEDNLVFCNNINDLMLALGHHHSPEEWRLFISTDIGTQSE